MEYETNNVAYVRGHNLTMNNLKFIVDDFDDSVLVEVIKTENNSPVKTFKRMDYYQFLNYINRIFEKEEERLEAIAKFKEEELKRKMNSVGKQASEISLILNSSRGLNISKPFTNVVAIEDRRQEEGTEAIYSIYFEINSTSSHNFREIIYDGEFYQLGNNTIQKGKRVSFDYGSNYIVKIPIIEMRNRIITDEIEVTRKFKYADGTQVIENIPFLEKLYSEKLEGKSLDFLADVKRFKYIFNTMPVSKLNENALLRNRIEEIKNTSKQMDWEGLI